MGLFRKKEKPVCEICGKEAQYDFKAGGGIICGWCRSDLMKVLPEEEWDGLTIEDLKDISEGKKDSPAAEKLGKCSACGSPLFAGSVVLFDGNLCGDCVKLMRGRYPIEKDVDMDPDNDYIYSDTLQIHSVSEAKREIEEIKELMEKAAEDYGGKYENVFCVDADFECKLKAIECGIKRSKELKGKLILRGIAAKGSFEPGDDVLFLIGETEMPVRILDVVVCAGEILSEEIGKYDRKKSVSAGENAWLILDMEYGEMNPGDVITGYAVH